MILVTVTVAATEMVEVFNKNGEKKGRQYCPALDDVTLFYSFSILSVKLEGKTFYVLLKACWQFKDSSQKVERRKSIDCS